MSKLELFKADSFNNIAPKEIWEFANQKLNEWLEANSVKVKGCLKFGFVPENLVDGSETHEALFINAQEIKKECEHEPVSIFSSAEIHSHTSIYHIRDRAVCKKCSISLKAKWEDVE